MSDNIIQWEEVLIEEDPSWVQRNAIFEGYLLKVFRGSCGRFRANRTDLETDIRSVPDIGEPKTIEEACEALLKSTNTKIQMKQEPQLAGRDELISIEEANKAFPIGTKVRYYSTAGLPNYTKTTIRSEAWDLCGSTVMKVEGIAGGVCVTHLFKAE
ncbi:hypothetical protein [Vibrio alginolyticus]|uniref:hypothetical protein n=1 Tax=Vibrio TaxID=662 RepID=UPI0009BEEC80|nr:hypothetical protein [Vibrio alginolyticus]CAH7130537.1 hypothetical protein VCHA51O444_10048 [Vibrio chagasii]CAH7221840.1 hypothetical protein VCHA53O474_240047 [Vibrio chagasii]